MITSCSFSSDYRFFLLFLFFVNQLTLIIVYLFFTRSLPADFVRLDQDILSPLAGKKMLYTYETMDFWEQIKTPGLEYNTFFLAH